MIIGGLLRLFNVKKIIILGSSGGCLDLIDLIEDINAKKKTFTILGLLDDNKNNNNLAYPYKILGSFNKVKKYLKNKDIYFATAIGSQKNFFNKKKILKSLNISLSKFPNLIHPQAIIKTTIPLGKGNIFHSGVKINRNVKINNMNLFLQNSIIHHDTNIGSYNFFNSATTVAGNVKIKNSNYFGQKVNIRDKVTINSYNLIGMGSIIIKNINCSYKIITNKIIYKTLNLKTLRKDDYIKK